MTGSREFAVPPDLRELRRLRADARTAAAELGVADRADALCLVVDELVSNAIEHGGCYRRGTTPLPLRLRVAVLQGRVELDFVDPEMPEGEVQDLADSLRQAGEGLPALDSERGRGLFLVAIHMEELRVAVAAGGGLHLHGRLSDS